MKGPSKPIWGLDNPHPLSQVKTELVWEGKYDQYGNRRTVEIAGCAMPLQKIETIDEPRSRCLAMGDLFNPKKALPDDFRLHNGEDGGTRRGGASSGMPRAFRS